MSTRANTAARVEAPSAAAGPVPFPRALVTVEQAAAALGVSVLEVELRAEAPAQNNPRVLRLPDGRVVAVIDQEAEALNGRAGYRMWPLCQITGTHLSEQTAERMAQRGRGRAADGGKEPSFR